MGALLVGVHFAKALGITRGLPVVPVHHMEGHLFATALEHEDAVPPFTALLVSGGHTLLLDVPEWGSYRLLGRTRDDAVGEAFDKVAKLLGLPYPGGRPLEELARTGDPSRHRFARPMLKRNQTPADPDYYDLSFSGLKTAVLLAVRDAEARGVLADEAPHIARAAMRAARSDAQVFAPTPRLATDNAAMIAAAGAFRFRRGEVGDAAFSAHAAWPIPGMFDPGTSHSRL